jgi:hypothetical protein
LSSFGFLNAAKWQWKQLCCRAGLRPMKASFLSKDEKVV